MENALEKETVLENETAETIEEPIVIEKKQRKKRETQSPAQLETLRRGRERLAEKRKKQLEERESKVTERIEKLEKKPEPPPVTPPLRPKIFV